MSRCVGTVFFIIRWWDPRTFAHHLPEDTGPWPAWPLLESEQALWTWLFVVPLLAYSLWQMLYFFVVNVLRRQRLLRDPEVMTSFRSVQSIILLHWDFALLWTSFSHNYVETVGGCQILRVGFGSAQALFGSQTPDTCKSYWQGTFSKGLPCQ